MRRLSFGLRTRVLILVFVLLVAGAVVSAASFHAPVAQSGTGQQDGSKQGATPGQQGAGQQGGGGTGQQGGTGGATGRSQARGQQGGSGTGQQTGPGQQGGGRGARQQATGGPGASGGAGGARSAGRAVPVEAIKAQSGVISQTFTYAGSLQASDSVRVTPLVSGRIDSVKVKVGDVVKAGDTLAQIETTTFQAQVAQAQAAYVAAQQRLVRQQIGSRPEEIAAAQAAVTAAQVALNVTINPNDDQRKVAAVNVDKSQAALQQAQHEYDRVASAPNVAMTSQALALQQATITYESALATYNLTIKPNDGQLATLQNNLAQAQLKLVQTKQPYLESDLAQTKASADQANAALDIAKAQLDNTTIRAPFDGVVAEIYVTKGTSAGPSGAIALLISTANVIGLDIDEGRISQVKNGLTATFRVSAYPGRAFSATVTSVAPIADSRSHSFAVQLMPTDDGNLLRPGMYGDVTLLATLKQNAVLLPTTALTQVQNRTVVYVIKNDNTVEMRPVTLGLSDPGRVEILSGVGAGETVVTAGQSSLINGSTVTITQGRVTDTRIAASRIDMS